MASSQKGTTGLAFLRKALEHVDPVLIEKRFPHPKMEEDYKAALACVKGLLDDAREFAGGIDSSLLLRIEEASKLLRKLYDYLAEQTELAARTRLSEVVMLAEAGHVERSIFLAGVANGKKLREPYKTQIAVLPAHACLFRYRQANKIEAWIHEELQTPLPDAIMMTIEQQKTSLLQQMDFFAAKSFSGNSRHPFAIYMYMLASLLHGFHLEQEGRSADAKRRYSQALELVRAIPEPRPSSHYMEMQYHRMNYNEFANFEQLSSRHKRICNRLETLCEQAEDLWKRGEFRKPRASFNLIPYVTLGARAASVAGVIVMTSAVFQTAGPDVVGAVSNLFDIVTRNIPGIGDITSAAHSLFAHTGGLPDISQFAHTGGLPPDLSFPDLGGLLMA